MAEGGGGEQATGAGSGTHDIFISYASPNSAVADAVAAALERHGRKCWMAPRDVTPGAHYASEIVHAIDSAKAIVLILSQDAATSPHVLREIERATSKRHPIVTVRVDQAPLPAEFEYFLNTSQWLDASGGDATRMMPKLVEAVKSALKAPAATPAAALTSHAPAHSGSARSPKRTAIVVTSLIGLALAGFAADRLWLSSHRTASTPASTKLASAPAPAASTIPEKSIAVLPFTDMSEKKDQEYFADGMAEEILDLLAKLPGIRVIGRTSSFQFKNKTEDLRKIGSTLGAAYVVEGSVRRSSDRIRVTAQLIGAKDGSHLWSETYDEPSDDVLKVQDRIASGLVRALQVTVGADDLGTPPLLKSSEAYDFYLRGRHAIDQWDRAGFEAAEGYFQQALELDPTSVRTAEWLATAQLYRAIWGFVPPHEGFERARLTAQRALKLNPISGTAHAVLASINTDYDWDWPAADHECEQALALEPRNPNVVGDAGFARSPFAQPDESARLITTALALDPLNGTWHELLGQMRYRAGRLAEAEAELHKALEISPAYAEAHFFLGQVLLAKGEPEAALVVMQQEVPESGRDTGLAIAYHALGRRAESDRALARQTKEHASDSAYEIAQAHSYRAELDEAFAWLDRAYIQKDVELYWIRGDPLLKNLEGDARYKAFLRKMNLPE